MNRLTHRSRLCAFYLLALQLLATVGCAQEQRTNRPYGERALWNLSLQELAAHLQRNELRHPQSEELVRRLWNDTDRPGNFNLMPTYALYRINADNQNGLEEKVVYSDSGWGNLNGEIIPWHPDWQGPGDHPDKQVILWDELHGREWNLWKVRVSESHLDVGNGNLIVTEHPEHPGERLAVDYRSYTGSFRSSRGSGIQYGAMLITQEDIELGTIEHALSLRIPVPDGRIHVAPATKQEHTDAITGIPTGTRFALSMSAAEIEAWADSQTVVEPRYAKMLAQALVDYGFFVTDTAWGGRHLSSTRSEDEVRVDISQHRTAANSFDVESGTTARLWAEIGFEGNEFRDLLDGLMTPDRLFAVVESDAEDLVGQGPNQAALFRSLFEIGTTSDWS